MSLNIRLLREEECETFKEMHDASFLTQAKFFKDGILPGFEDESEDEYDVASLLKNPGYTVLSIRDDDLPVGGSIVEAKENHVYEIFEFFIGVEHQGRGIGKEALKLVEDYFSDARVFRLVTPSQVVRNCVFYVNKCGYHIVKVIDYNEKENCADYLFEKTIENKDCSKNQENSI